MSRTQAKAGGELAESNGYFYKGGQFLPSTEAKPGTFKIGKKTLTIKKELVEPAKLESQPSPLSRAIFQMIHCLCISIDDKLVINPRIRDVNVDTLLTPGIVGILGKQSITLQELIDQYNNGQRWFTVEIGE